MTLEPGQSHLTGSALKACDRAVLVVPREPQRVRGSAPPARGSEGEATCGIDSRPKPSQPPDHSSWWAFLVEALDIELALLPELLDPLEVGDERNPRGGLPLELADASSRVQIAP